MLLLPNRTQLRNNIARRYSTHFIAKMNSFDNFLPTFLAQPEHAVANGFVANDARVNSADDHLADGVGVDHEFVNAGPAAITGLPATAAASATINVWQVAREVGRKI